MIKTWQQRCEEHPDHNGIVSEGMIQARMQEEIDELRAAIEQTNDWDEVEALRASLREHMAEIKRLRAVIETNLRDDRRGETNTCLTAN